MKTFPLFTALLASSLASIALAEEKPVDEKPAEEKSAVKQELKALILEDAKSKGPKPSDKPPLTSPSDKTGDPAVKPDKTKPAAPDDKAAAPAPAVDPKKAPVEMSATLPTVEVNKSKVTELNRELHEQDIKIAREEKSTKSTELDTALNGPAMNIKVLGGESTQVRTGIAKERVELMKTERDLIEAVAKAKTKEDKVEFQKQLDEIRAMRRELEKQR